MLRNLIQAVRWLASKKVEVKEPPPLPKPVSPRLTTLFSPQDNGTCQVLAHNPITGETIRCGRPGHLRFFRKPDIPDTEMVGLTACQHCSAMITATADLTTLKIEVL